MLPQQQTLRKRMTQKALDNFFVPHTSLPLPVPLSLSLISLEAGVAVHGGSDHFAPVQQQNVILPLGDHQHLFLWPALAGSLRYMSHVLIPGCLVHFHLVLVHS